MRTSSQVGKKKNHDLKRKAKNGIAFVEFHTTRYTIQINIISELNEYKLFEWLTYIWTRPALYKPRIEYAHHIRMIECEWQKCGVQLFIYV